MPTAPLVINGEIVMAPVLPDPQAGDESYDLCGHDSPYEGRCCTLPDYHGLVHVAAGEDETGTFEYRVVEIWGHEQ